ncbi:dynactin subunit 3-like [Ornithodoros turicata]|uniref:dynactin subunit 3-like n=1 Tax=Ornithodoros turicata TaxID=34597 RepID=UPI003139E263
MADIDALTVLEDRISQLEHQITGNDSTKELPSKSTITEALLGISSKLQAVLALREKLDMLKRVDEIEKYLEAEFQAKADLTEGAKLNVVLAEEDRIRSTIAALQKIEDLKPVLDSEHIKNTPSYSGEIMRLATIQIEQQEEVDKQSEKVRDLMSTYNDLVNTISRLFLFWDRKLNRALEEQEKTKKAMLYD